MADLAQPAVRAGTSGPIRNVLVALAFVLTALFILAPVVVIPAGWLASTAVSFVMGVIGLIEGWIYLAQSPEAFQAQYIDAKKEWF